MSEQLSDREIEELRLLIEDNKKAKYAAAYIRSILVWVGSAVAAVAGVWTLFKGLVKGATV